MPFCGLKWTEREQLLQREWEWRKLIWLKDAVNITGFNEIKLLYFTWVSLETFRRKILMYKNESWETKSSVSSVARKFQKLFIPTFALNFILLSILHWSSWNTWSSLKQIQISWGRFTKLNSNSLASHVRSQTNCLSLFRDNCWEDCCQWISWQDCFVSPWLSLHSQSNFPTISWRMKPLPTVYADLHVRNCCIYKFKVTRRKICVYWDKFVLHLSHKTKSVLWHWIYCFALSLLLNYLPCRNLSHRFFFHVFLFHLL